MTAIAHVDNLLYGGRSLVGFTDEGERLVTRVREANRLIDGGGVRVDGAVVSDKGLKLAAGTYVLQVGKRKFMRVTLG